MNPDSLAQQAHLHDQEQNANDALEKMLRANPDLLKLCKQHRWFVALTLRIESEAKRA